MRGEEFAAPGEGGHLGGWVAGSGEPVVLLHGGPGMGATYLAPVFDELAGGYQVVLFQQRALAPSTLSGPFDVDTAVDDIRAVLDHLAIERPRATELDPRAMSGEGTDAGPIPVTASVDSADRIPGAWVEVLEGAGHMFWTERPGHVRPALRRLAAA
jgi:pimeloyl-ACP methyl ester carboxylesterase